MRVVRIEISSISSLHRSRVPAIVAQSNLKPKEFRRKHQSSNGREMEEEDWGLSMEELDTLEKDAIRKMADRQKSSSTASGSSSQGKRALPSTVMSSPAKNVGGQVTVKIFKDRPGKIALETQYNQVGFLP
eukprot:Gb_39381 [translate_table: standard]